MASEGIHSSACITAFSPHSALKPNKYAALANLS